MIATIKVDMMVEQRCRSNSKSPSSKLQRCPYIRDRWTSPVSCAANKALGIVGACAGCEGVR